VEGLSGSVEGRSKLNRMQRNETENRKERNFTLYSTAASRNAQAERQTNRRIGIRKVRNFTAQ
jgi:hypothetical protein